jgi:hypothetical protein
MYIELLYYFNMAGQIIFLLLGAFLALLSSLVVEFFRESREKKKLKIEVISLISQYGFMSYRLLNRSVGHNIWFNYYMRSLSLLDAKLATKDEIEVKKKIQSDIKFRIEEMEKIERELIVLDGQISSTAAKFLYLFGEDEEFERLVGEVRDFKLSEYIKIHDFQNHVELDSILNLSMAELNGIVKEDQDYIEDIFMEKLNSLMGYCKTKIGKY